MARSNEPANRLVAIDLSHPTCGRVLAEGHDFYSSPKLSPDGAWVAYLAWDHPLMPWVGTTLYVVSLDAAGIPSGEAAAIAGGTEESIFQPEWSPDGKALFFVSDRTGWWNLHRSAWPLRNVEVVLPMEAEFGQPQWVFGMSTYAFAGAGRLVCSYALKGLSRLGGCRCARMVARAKASHAGERIKEQWMDGSTDARLRWPIARQRHRRHHRALGVFGERGGAARARPRPHSLSRQGFRRPLADRTRSAARTVPAC